MNNKAEVKKIFEAIKEETNPMEAIKKLANTTYEIGDEACHERHRLSEKVGELSEKLDKIDKIICGNGDPTSSLISRMDRLETLMDTLKSDTATIKALLVGDLKSGDRKSINERVRDVEKVTANATRVTWVLITIVIGEFLARILGLF